MDTELCQSSDVFYLPLAQADQKVSSLSFGENLLCPLSWAIVNMEGMLWEKREKKENSMKLVNECTVVVPMRSLCIAEKISSSGVW